MKIICQFVLILVFSCGSWAQEKKDSLENRLFLKDKPNERYELFEFSPEFKFPHPDGLVFSDSIRRLPGQLPMAWLPGKMEYAQGQMPVYKPGADFYSNMPVMVPDTSVHYFILNKKINRYDLRPEEEN